MAQQLSLRGGGSIDRELLQDYVSALQSITSIRALLFLLLLVSLLTPLALYGGVTLGWLAPPADVVTEEGADAVPSMTTAQAPLWASTAMRVAAFVARAMAVLLAVAYLLAIQICFVARMGGVKDGISAFFWIALLLLFLVPWQAWLGAVETPQIFYDVRELVQADTSFSEALAATEGAMGRWLLRGGHYAKFFLFPCLALMTAAVGDIRFGFAYRQGMQQVRRYLEGESQ